MYTVRERKKIKACGEVYPSSRIGILNRVRERKLKYAVNLGYTLRVDTCEKYFIRSVKNATLIFGEVK